MRNYQLVLVLRPSLKDADRKKLTDNVKGWLKDAKITKEEEWGQKPLAYKIDKELSGYYLNLLFETEVVPSGLEKNLLAQENILRHLLLKTDVKTKETIPSKEKKATENKKTEEKKEVKKSKVSSKKKSI